MLSSKNLFYYSPNDDDNNAHPQQQQQQQERRIVQFVFVVQRQIIGILFQFLSLLLASSCLLKLKDDKTRKEGINNIISNDNNKERKDEDEESSTGTTISTTTTTSSTDYDDDDIDIDETSNNNEEQEDDDNEYYMKEYNDGRCSFPHEEIQSLQNRHDKLEKSLSSSVVVGLLPTTTIDEIPSSLSYDANLLLLLKIQKIQLMGIFPTSRWLYDPTMPPDIKEMFGGTPFFPLGEYRVANIDLLSTTTTTTTNDEENCKGNNSHNHCATTRKKELVIIVNTGVEGMDIGYYGGCFERDEPNKCYAKFDNSKVKIVTSLATTKQEEESRIRRINQQQQQQQSRDNIGNTDDADASTQLRSNAEQSLCQRLLLDDTVKVLLDLDWKTGGGKTSIPKSMIEICDTSPRIERQRQRRISAELTTTRRRLLLSSSSPPPTATTQQPKVRSSYSTSKRFLFAD